ncbi:MAG: Ig-like domain-containing protein [Gemmatimonadetes bacterium]|nr:Ig-like domain-containing protein [Gemmatimonadota bacterium]
MRRALALAALVAGGAAGCDEFPVDPPAVAEIVITAERTTLLVGETARLEATPVGFDGERLEGARVGWRSLHPEIAAVDAEGVVTGIAPGRATIVASSRGREASVTMEVEPRAASLEIVGNTTVTLGDTVRLAARTRSATGEPIDRPVRWASLDLDVALVAKNGSVRGIALGSAPIVARLEGLADTVDVRVVEPEPTPTQALVE